MDKGESSNLLQIVVGLAELTFEIANVLTKLERSIAQSASDDAFKNAEQQQQVVDDARSMQGKMLSVTQSIRAYIEMQHVRPD